MQIAPFAKLYQKRTLTTMTGGQTAAALDRQIDRPRLLMRAGRRLPGWVFGDNQRVEVRITRGALHDNLDLGPVLVV